MRYEWGVLQERIRSELLSRAESWLRPRDLELAREILDLRVKKGRAMCEMRFEEAARIHDRLVKACRQLLSSDADRFESAVRHALLGEYESASGLAELAIKEAPDREDAWFLAGEIAAMHEDFERAERCWRRSAFLNPERFAHPVRARQGDRISARIQRVHEAAPDAAEVLAVIHRELAHVESMLGKSPVVGDALDRRHREILRARVARLLED